MGDLNNDEDLILPKSTVRRIIDKTNNRQKLFSVSARDFINKCSTEFIHIISLEASTVCANDSKKTINHVHILKALQNLGFGDFKNRCEKFLNEYIQKSKKKSKKVDKFKESGLSKEEFEKQQLELFKNAKIEYEKMEDDDK